MAAQDIFTIESNSSEQSAAVKAFAEALKMKFKISISDKVDASEEIEIPEAHKVIVAERLAD